MNRMENPPNLFESPLELEEKGGENKLEKDHLLRHAEGIE